MEVIVNPKLERELLAYGCGITVLSPQSLVESIRRHHKAALIPSGTLYLGGPLNDLLEMGFVCDVLSHSAELRIIWEFEGWKYLFYQLKYLGLKEGPLLGVVVASYGSGSMLFLL